jgi:hypothetical protein
MGAALDRPLGAGRRGWCQQPPATRHGRDGTEKVDMNNDALVSTLGMDAVGAVHGYRQAVIAEAARRGLGLMR